MSPTLTVFLGCLIGLGILVLIAVTLGLRRWWVRRATRQHDLHVRLLRAELMQAVARGEHNFLIEHWTKRDRAAALEVASQILSFLRGPDRQRLEAIVEENQVLRKPLLRINRLSRPKRIAMIRTIAPFGNQSVQGTLHAILRYDRSTAVRLEAALAISVAGTLPTPWRVIRAVWKAGRHLTPNHYSLFRTMADPKLEAMIAIATLQEELIPRLLAIDALAHAGPNNVERAANALKPLIRDEDPQVREATSVALELLSTERRSIRRVPKRAREAQEAVARHGRKAAS